MNKPKYVFASPSEYGRRGGLVAARRRRERAADEQCRREWQERLAMKTWPPCPRCGEPTHMNYCVGCDASTATM